MSLRNLSAAIKIPKLLKDKLKNNKINQIYYHFERSLKIDQNFLVGISGGPDSLALAFLAKIYSIKKNLKVKFYIVDHKLRPDSTKEAKNVKKILKKFFINAEILTWHGRKPISNIQSLARKKRYELLISMCKKQKFNNILLGHHQDDLFENFFIRILRGSGLKGLVSFKKKSKTNNVNILRPLLDLKKKDLVFISKYIFNFYANDPSNSDDKFQRIRIRKLISNLEDEGLDKNKFLLTINNLKHSDETIMFYVEKNLQKNCFFSEKKNEMILNNEFFSQPYEVVFRSLSNIITKIGKNYYSARGKKLDKVLSEISKKSFYKATLGGCIIEKVKQTVIITKEY